MAEKNDIIFELETENNEGKVLKEFKQANIVGIANKVVINFITLKPTPIKDCGCNIGLKLINIGNDDVVNNSLPPFYTDKKTGTTPDLYIELGNNNIFYKVLNVMPNGTTNSPDVIDPVPSRPTGTSSRDKWASSVIKDKYIAENLVNPINPTWLNGLPHRNTGYPVVAVMDTGIDMRFFTDDVGNTDFPLHYYQNNPCDINPNYLNSVNGLFGWSFIKDDSNPEHPFDDDNRHKHGTRIAKIIANVTGNKVRIMSLKTADHTGESAFFAIFCAFEYILSYNKKCVANNLDKDKVKLINASWGYYGASYDMFKSYIGKLGGNGDTDAIKFVNAAGNAGDIGNDNIEIGTSPTTNRYPTMYAPDFGHVYTVTTLDWSDDNDAVENYSSKYVEIGVRGRAKYIPRTKRGQNLNWFERIVTPVRQLFQPALSPNEGDTVFGTFPDPLTPPSTYGYIKGSSYATAYVTGFMVNRPAFGNFQRTVNNPIENAVNAKVIAIQYTQNSITLTPEDI